MSSHKKITIANLPPEVLSKVFSYLKVRYRKNCSLVCKEWMYATRCPSFYRVLKLHKGVYLDEPPLSVFKKSYHPFSVIWFDAIDEFNENLESLWKEMQESVRELIFSSCEGLEDEKLEHMLKFLNEVHKIKIIGSSNLSGNKLNGTFEKITILDLSDTEMPKMYIEDLVKSFPKLKELNLGSYTYDGWDSHEEYIQNVSPTAQSSAFGEWLKDLCQLAPKVTLSYDYQIVRRMDVMLKEFMQAPNLEIYSLNLEVKDVPNHILQQFLVTKGRTLQKLEIPEASTLDTLHYELINTNCQKLKKLTLCFSDDHLHFILESLSGLNLLEKLVITKAEDKRFELKFTRKPLNLSKMRTLLMFNCTLESQPSDFELFLKSFPFLTELCLSECIISPDHLKEIFKTCTKLERIHLNCNESITDETLIGDDEASLLNLRYLETINLNGSTSLTDATISRFSWPELYKLGLRELCNITVEGIRQLCASCPTIEHLDLNGCKGIDDACVLIITQTLTKLEDLDLSGTAATPLALTYIDENCKNIKNVNVSYKPPPTSKAAEKLLQKRILHFLAAVAMGNITSELVIPSDEMQ